MLMPMANEIVARDHPTPFQAERPESPGYPLRLRRPATRRMSRLRQSRRSGACPVGRSRPLRVAFPVSCPQLRLDLIVLRQRSLELVVEEPHRIENFAQG